MTRESETKKAIGVGRRVAVFGAGRSGVASANFLAARGVDVVITDAAAIDRLPLAGQLLPEIRKCFGGHPDDVLDGVETIVLSPGVPRALDVLRKASDAGIPILSEVELAFRQLNGRVIAITGSNGKSTTTALIGKILEIAGMSPVVAGNIGSPLIGAVASEPRIYVVELSSFQLETIDEFRADVALLLNITPDHMDRYRSFDDYAAAKHRVFNRQRAGDLAVVNADDDLASHPRTAGDIWRFSSSGVVRPGAWYEGEDLILSTGDSESRISRGALRLAGLANVENALAAWLAARFVGVADEEVRRAFEQFEGLPHRMVTVAEIEGVRWVNDSKGTNVDATLKSLLGMEPSSVILILGGRDKAGEFERLIAVVEEKVRLVLTIGEAAARIESALEGATETIHCGDMIHAVEVAREKGEAGNVVLLSPACASFDQYGNFEERGMHFSDLVRAWR